LIGRLADGREEWLEFWRRNHLLPPFDELHARREEGAYGGKVVPFLSLLDLMRSKETERETDWQDISLLEEILDARNLSRVSDAASTVAALSLLRSRRGFERAAAQGYFADQTLVTQAMSLAPNPVTRAYLMPYQPERYSLQTDTGTIGEILAGPLRGVVPASPRHLALVEAIRRLFKQSAMAADRADKMAIWQAPSKRKT
jgi:hypothetical protein